MKFILALLLLSTYSVRGQDRSQKMDSLLTALHANHKFNGNVLVAEKGKVLYCRSFGYANEATREKLTKRSVFELASCSKAFTAMAVMLLKEQHRLHLDDEIKTYLPELSIYQGITIRHLLTHTSGLPDYVKLLDRYFDKAKIASNRDIIDLLTKHHPPVLFEPNSKYEYSNTGYALLASIIEKTSGLTYAQYLERRIFKPLHMKHTFVYNRRLSPKNIRNYAFGYVYSDSLKTYQLPDKVKETKLVVWLDGVVGDGTVNSTVKDLLKWDRALYGNDLLSPAGMREIFQAATLNDLSKSKYGFGWLLSEHPAFGHLSSHGGSWPGYITYIDRHTTNDKTIILLQNHDDVSIPLTSLRNILYYKPLPVPKAKTDSRVPK